MLIVLLFIAFIVAFEVLAYFWIPTEREERPAEEVPIGELEARFKWWEKLAAIPVIALVIPTIVGWFYLFWFIRDWLHSQLPPSDMLLVPSVVVFIVPALFLGICTVLFPVAWVYRLLLGSDYDEYTRYTTERTQANPAMTYYRLAQFCVPIAVGFSLLACDWYTRLTPTEFADNSILSLGEARYAMNDIVELRRIDGFIAPNGNHVKNPYFEIVFTDGFRWNSSQDLYSLRDTSYARLMKKISDATGKKVVQYQLPPP